MPGRTLLVLLGKLARVFRRRSEPLQVDRLVQLSGWDEERGHEGHKHGS